MKDTIYREDAIKAIEDRQCWLTLASQHRDMGRVLWDEYYIKFEDAIEALLLISSADRLQEWIPCSERLPEEEGIYLVTATNRIFDTEEITVGTCYFNIEYGFSNNRKILAWMPLPKPWKGADDENVDVL